MDFSCDDIIIKNSLSEKILGLTIDHNLEFSDHISNICKTASQKLNALFRVSANMNCLFWMFCNWKSTKKVNKYKNVTYV